MGILGEKAMVWIFILFGIIMFIFVYVSRSLFFKMFGKQWKRPWEFKGKMPENRTMQDIVKFNFVMALIMGLVFVVFILVLRFVLAGK